MNINNVTITKYLSQTDPCLREIIRSVGGFQSKFEDPFQSLVESIIYHAALLFILVFIYGYFILLLFNQWAIIILWKQQGSDKSNSFQICSLGKSISSLAWAHASGERLYWCSSFSSSRTSWLCRISYDLEKSRVSFFMYGTIYNAQLAI